MMPSEQYDIGAIGGKYFLSLSKSSISIFCVVTLRASFWFNEKKSEKNQYKFTAHNVCCIIIFQSILLFNI